MSLQRTRKHSFGLTEDRGIIRFTYPVGNSHSREDLMTKNNVGLTIAFAILLGAALSSPADAQSVTDLKATINGTPSKDPTVSTGGNKSWVNIAGNYTFGTPPSTYTITIAPKCTTGAAPANLARIEAGDDTQDDLIALKNARITISSIPNPAPEHLISFRGTFNNPPSTNRSVNPELRMGYRLDGSNDGNSFMRNLGGAAGNSVRARGSVEFPKDSNTWWPIENETSIEVNTANFSPTVKNFFHGPDATAFKIEKTWSSTTSPNDLNGPRVLKGDFWFKFTNTSDILSIPKSCATPASGYVQINTYPVFIPPQP